MRRRTFLAAGLTSLAAFAAKEMAVAETPISEVEAAEKSARRLAVFHVPDSVLTQTVIGPSRLETYRHTVVHHSDDRRVVEAALTYVLRARPHTTADVAELRWKLVFFNAADERVLEVFAAPHALLGRIGTRPVRFADDSLVNWLNATFGQHASA